MSAPVPFGFRFYWDLFGVGRRVFGTKGFGPGLDNNSFRRDQKYRERTTQVQSVDVRNLAWFAMKAGYLSECYRQTSEVGTSMKFLILSFAFKFCVRTKDKILGKKC